MALMLAWNEYPLNWVATLPQRLMSIFESTIARALLVRKYKVTRRLARKRVGRMQFNN